MIHVSASRPSKVSLSICRRITDYLQLLTQDSNFGQTRSICRPTRMQKQRPIRCDCAGVSVMSIAKAACILLLALFAGVCGGQSGDSESASTPTQNLSPAANVTCKCTAPLFACCHSAPRHQKVFAGCSHRRERELTVFPWGLARLRQCHVRTRGWLHCQRNPALRDPHKHVCTRGGGAGSGA